MIVVLAGGVGAARFLQGVVQVVPQEEITVIANTGDDSTFYGLHVSPDVEKPPGAEAWFAKAGSPRLLETNQRLQGVPEITFRLGKERT